jgi:hypothetical protein
MGRLAFHHMNRNKRGCLAGSVGQEVVTALVRKQIGIEAIGQRDTGDRHIGT